MGIYYSEAIDGGVWTVTATLRCDACAAELGCGVKKLRRAISETRARAARSEAASKAALLAALNGFRPDAEGHYWCTEHATGVHGPDNPRAQAVRDETARVTREPMEWGDPAVSEGSFHVTASELPAGTFAMELRVTACGILFCRTETVESAQTARARARDWAAIVPSFVTAMYEVRERYPYAVQRRAKSGEPVVVSA